MRALVAGGVLLGALLAEPARAWPAEVCAGVVAATASAVEALDRRVRAEPAAVLAAACAAEPSHEMQLLAAEALLELSRPGDADRLLAPLADAAAVDPPPPWAARWWLVQGLRHGAAGQTVPAQQALAQAQQRLLAQGLERSRLAFRAHIAQGLHARRRGDIGPAEAAAAAAEALLAPLGLAVSMEATDLLNLRTLLAYARQDLQATMQGARAELAMLEQLGQGSSADAMFAWSSLGATLSQLQRHAEARAAYESGLRIADAHPGIAPFGRQGLLNNLATEHLALGEHEAALARAEQALELGRTTWGEDSPRLLRPQTTIGTAHHMAARYGQAIAAYERARALAQRQGASAGRHLQLELVDLHAGSLASLGDHEAARAAVDDGIASTAGRSELSFWHGRLLVRRANLHAESGRWADADADAEAAMRLVGAVQGERHATVVEWGAVRCIAQLRAGLEPTACQALESALPALDHAAPFRRHRALSALAEHAQHQGRAEEAEAHLFAALAAAQRQGGPDPMWQALDALARHLRRQGQPTLAVYFGKQAVLAIEQLRHDVVQHARATEQRFVADKAEVYRRLAGWLAEDGRVAEALDTLRWLKEDEFFDFTQRNGRLAAGARDRVDLTAAEQAVDERWRTLQQAEPSASSEASWAARARALATRLASEAPASPARESGEPPRATVPDGELHVFAISGARQLTLVLDSRVRRQVHRIDWPGTELGREVGALLAALGRREYGLEPLQALYRRFGALLADSARADRARRIVLHLDGSLRYLPVGALHDGHAYLAQSFAVEHRAAAVVQARPQPPVPGLRLRALGLARAVAGRKALPGVAREVCAIVDGPVHGLEGTGCARGSQGAVPGEGWLDAAFTAERLAQALHERPAAARSMLHMGTHFDLRPGSIERSTLLLGDGSTMSLAQLAEHSFGAQALVTLSACETGVGGAQGGDGREVEGMNMTILRRGAGAVLASLWRVDDASTSVLMQAFYRELRRAGPAEALQRAQRAVRDRPQWATPFHWAGFYVTTRQP